MGALSRLLVITKSKIVIVAVLLLAAYALGGFVLVPYLVGHYLPRYAEQQLRRHASIGEVRFNPFLLRFEAKDFTLTEGERRPIGGFKRLFVDLELESLWRRAWVFKEIRLEGPTVLMEIGPGSRINLVELGDSLPKSEPPPEPDQSIPRFLVRHLALNAGHFTFSDRSDRTPANATIEPIDLELDNISTLPPQQAPYVLTAQLPGGGTLRWSGEVSLQPLRSAGRAELTGLKPAAFWGFIQDKLSLAEPQGALDVQANYDFFRGDGGPRLVLKDLAVKAKGIVLAHAGTPEPILKLDSVRLLDGQIDLSAHDVAFGTLEVGPGHVRVEVDERGAINWQKLTPGGPEPLAKKTSEPPAAPWKVSLSALRIADIGLRYEDASHAAPIRLDIGKLDLGLALALETQAAGIGGTIHDGRLTLADIALAERDHEAPLIKLQNLEVSDVRVDLGARDVHAGRVAFGGGGTSLENDKDGRIRLLDVLGPGRGGEDDPGVAKAQGTPWSFAGDSVALENFAVAAADRSLEPAAIVNVLAKRLALTDVRSDGKTPMGFQAAIEVNEGGALNAEGHIGANGKTIDGGFKVADLNLAPLKPYVSRFTSLRLASGKLAIAGQFRYQGEDPGPSVSYDGTLGVSDLLLQEAASGERFMAWRSLSAKGIKFGLAPDRLNIAEVRILEPGAKIVIFKDHSVNLAKVVKSQNATEKRASAPAKPVKTRAAGRKRGASGAQFPVNVEQLRMEKGTVDFADLSLVLPFATRVWDFKGSTNGISSGPASRTKLQFEGRVDQYGLAKVDGALQAFQPKKFTDISVTFRNVEMTPLSPYSATFAGRKIASGKLNLDLQYKIADSHLAGENKVLLDKFSLGERVEAPGAVDLPLDLAVALLSDSSGKIDLAVPVSGDVDQPEFSYGGVIWGAFVNLITNAVTAPFRALGSLLGGSDQPPVDAIMFDAGSAQLSPPEQEKLKKVVDALKQRPALALTAQGRFEDERDGKALRTARVRQALAARLNVKLAPGEDAPPASFDTAKTQRALEAMLEARGGPDAVAGFKTEHERSTGKEAKRLNPALALIGRASPDTVFYQAMFERLTELEPLADSDLTVLAQSRGEAMVKALSALGVEASRIATGSPAPAEKSDGTAVASALTLNAIKAGE